MYNKTEQKLFNCNKKKIETENFIFELNLSLFAVVESPKK